MFKSIARYHFLLIILIASSGVIISIYSMMTYKSVHQPLKSLVEAFEKVQKGELDIRLKHQYNNEFGYIYIGFNSMIENINSLIEQVYKKEIFKQQAELKHLQSQINPHFLYNSFFILRSIIHNEEYDKAEDFVQKLGDYFQFITRSGKDFIPLSTEVGHAKVYTEIQMTRFSNRINMTFEALPEKYSNIFVPRLILQPIIENVFEHGLKNKLADGILQITFAEQEDKLLIKVEDNGDELLDEDLQKLQNSILSNDDIETTGIINIHRRLQIKLGSESGLSVLRSELGGLAIVINISLTHSSVTYTQSASLENKSL
jgi:two-component system sensor histidine kinase YesM